MNDDRGAEYGTLVTTWENRTEWPLAISAVVFLVAYAWPILDPDVSPTIASICHGVDLVVWVAFAVDYVVRLVITRHRGRYFIRHLADFAMVVLPALRPLRLLRLLMLLKVLHKRAASSLHGQVGMYMSGAGVILLTCSSLAVLDAERGQPGATIGTFWDGVWWSFVTVSTVGYGDVTPVTTSGRMVGIGLMLGGVALLGVVTATFASWLVDRVREVSEAEQAVTKADIAVLRSEIAQLRGVIVGQTGGFPPNISHDDNSKYP